MCGNVFDLVGALGRGEEDVEGLSRREGRDIDAPAAGAGVDRDLTGTGR
jgi:hypothetical protein